MTTRKHRPDDDEEDSLEGVFFDVHGEVYTLDEVLRRIESAKDGAKKRRFATG